MLLALARHPLTPWLPVVGWLAIVFGLGSSGFDADHTSRFLTPFLEWLLPDWRPWEIRRIHYWIRKLAHPCEYGVTALLVCRALWLTRPAWTQPRRAAATLGAVLLVATADELRQSYLTTRTGTVSDVALDAAGGLVGVLLAPWLLRQRTETLDG